MEFSTFELPAAALMPSAFPHTTKVTCLHARLMKIEELAHEIANVALYYNVFEIEAQDVDRLGEKKAIEMLCKACALAVRQHRFDIPIVIDGKYEIQGIRNQRAIVKADVTHANVSAAAIISKHIANDFFYEMDKQYPEYGFKTHKGYDKGIHLPCIEEYGLCPIHRPSFVEKAFKGPQDSEKTFYSLNHSIIKLAKIKELLLMYPELQEERLAKFLVQMESKLRNKQRITVQQQNHITEIYQKMEQKQSDFARIGII